ncbi:DUF6152 family protein [Variovorax sp. J22G21]|uniref:DUF6152 family protein n=1 Tax=Variovorax fucosicus TaxID=3053517 RepID=UPI002578204D|nr:MULTISPECIES: DUF6152 family protein [unclassified Variovorax]MDM0040960.1 DUF6152 family protein [Variovorax sp. J22R193]MDM0057331.1 DUF6152 family protein [Variovorax sp. J22G47]MDM0060017.1 DUF6152 family protein [Variovorax sp. J22G21]
MQRRHFFALAATSLVAPGVRAHHGWSSFDAERPIYLEGKVLSSRWQNPHAELVIELPADLKVPADLAQRALPAQSAAVDGKALLARAVVPTRKDRRWELELAPLTRMSAWSVEEIKPGTTLSAIGFTFKDEKGEAVMRVEYLFVGGKTYGLRSSPA